MKKRIVALLVMIVLVTGLFSTVAMAKEDNSLKVGYSKVDINPYVYHYVDENRPNETPVEIFTDENGREYYTNWNRDKKGNTTCELMPVPLRGFREPTERLCLPYKMDDNGDGLINNEDGIYGTCIAMTDTNGNTFITISIDMIGADENILVTQVQQSISRVLPHVAQDHIMLAGTHTHGAADFSKISSLKNDTNLYIRQSDGKEFTGMQISQYLTTYRDNIVYQLTQAAIQAVADQEIAVMSKGGIDTSEAANSPEGDRMNVVRHYVMTRQKIKKSNGAYVTDANGKYVADTKGVKVSNYIAGDNFNGGGDPVGTKYGTYVITSAKSVASSDDMLYALEFTFEGEKEPIVLINWRTHPCFNRNASQDEGKNGWPYSTSYYQTTSDYVNAFRKELEKSGYRVSFHQGAGGNIDGSDPTLELDWLDKADPTATKRGVIYGQTLGKIALELISDTKLSDGKKLEKAEGGEIRVAHTVYQNEGNTDSPALQAAAQLYEETYTGPVPLVGEGYEIIDKNGNGYGDIGEQVIDTTTGAYAVMASRYHAKAVISRMSSAAQKKSYGQVKLSAITIGTSVAFVAAPGELYDRYDSGGSVYDSSTSGWKSLVSSATYGTPFVLGYCNGTRGYFPNKAAYSYNYLLKDSAGNYTTDSVGSYEANTTRLAVGGGEELISCFREMLSTLVNYNQDQALPEVCEHCGCTVTWSGLNMLGKSVADLVSGHYYLEEDVTGVDKVVGAGEKICLYLNGYTLKGTTCGITVESGGELSIMGEGSVQGMNSSQGGAIYISGGGTANLYGGTLTLAEDFVNLPAVGGAVYIAKNATFNMFGGTITGGKVTYRGGNVYVGGTFNMYGGVVKNGEGAVLKDTDQPNGGNVYVDGVMNMYGGTVKDGKTYWAGGNMYVGGQLNMYSGEILGGQASTVSPCVHVSAGSTVTLSGDAVVDQIRSANTEFLTVSGKYTGKTTLVFVNTVAYGASVGFNDNAEFTKENIVYGKSGYQIIASGAHLRYGSLEAAKDATTGETYTYLQDAIDNCAVAYNTYVRLQKQAAEDIVVTQNTVLDLNGYNMLGDITVVDGVILWVIDSKTADYTVADGKYGKLKGVITGAVTAGSAYVDILDGEYIAITHEDGVSFHRVELKLGKVSLRPENAALYYTGTFYADEVVQENVVRFGVALNSAEMPRVSNMSTTTVATSAPASQWKSGEAVHGVLLSGVMKESNSAATNEANAQAYVYGCAYMELNSGYYFGGGVKITLQQVVETIDMQFGTLTTKQKAGLADMYHSYEGIMSRWNIPQLKQTAK